MEFVDRFTPDVRGRKDCGDEQTWGNKSTRYDYIVKSTTGDDPDEYPDEACTPWVHGNAQIDNFKVNNNLNATGTITGGEVKTASGITLSSRKPFDIPHPTKNGWRLRHVCLEGPESGVYYRGRLTNSNIIELPGYWEGLVDPETITVTLTQIGSSQDLIVEKIEWGKRIIIKSGTSTNIDCYFMINAERKDGERLIVEYPGTEINDYPGNNALYSINK